MQTQNIDILSPASTTTGRLNVDLDSGDNSDTRSKKIHERRSKAKVLLSHTHTPNLGSPSSSDAAALFAAENENMTDTNENNFEETLNQRLVT